jgi:hypothetical protein
MRLIKVTLALALVATALLGTAGAAFAWSPLTVAAPCSTNDQTLVWTVQASQTEANLDIQFADNVAFTGFTTYTLDSVTLSVQVTTPIVPEVWVRWASDNSVVSTGLAPTGCTQGTQDVIAPAGGVRGPCYDPSYYGIFDNSATTTQSIKFRMRWYTVAGLNAKVKVVPAGDVYDTWLHWAKPGTKVSVAYKSPTTGKWIDLASTTAAHGRFPGCKYTPGWQNPTD